VGVGEPPTSAASRLKIEIIDMSPDAVNDMARRGILKGYKIGNHWRFRREDMERTLWGIK
jgi:excisionase family DNA binding protein